MSYVNAPATELLATNCCCCNRPLVDAKSVETGIGPICRQKYGYDADVPEESRKAANLLVHKIAAAMSHDKMDYEVGRWALALRDAGFPKISDLVVARIKKAEKKAKIVITPRDHYLAVQTPYSPEFTTEVKAIPGRKGGKFLVGGKPTFMWLIPPKERRALWLALAKHFDGVLAKGPKGLFTVGQIPGKAA